MATATVNVLGQINLIGTTPDPSSAPITYTLRGAGGTSFSITPQNASSATISDIDGTRSRVTFAPNKYLIIPNESIAAVLANLNNAFPQVDRQIAQQVLVAAPAPPPPPPAPEPPRAPPPIDSSLEGSPEFQEQAAISSPPTPNEPLPISVLADGDTPLLAPVISEAELGELAAQVNADAAAAIAAAEEEAAAQAAAAEAAAAAERLRRENPFQPRSDWRVRLALSDAPDVNYLYKANNPGILKPLNATNGVIFPYTPTISVNYAANYNPTDLVHSNYKVFQYSNSSIDSITIQSDFTAQDEYEANYLLAVIHFFRSATKMFYGQDQNPRRGTPPPLCYIYGMGSYQFAGQPLAISQFSYNLPNNVDYITTSVGRGDTQTATTSATEQPPRMAGTGVARGGVLPPAQFTPIAEPGTVTWVPSKIQLSITCVPMMSRNAVSNEFSLEKYATGSLLNGVTKQFGGFW